ncbi:DUF6083 domain-containing protein [Streptomyces sp. CoH27]|uniref:DUF6083 domain-containing protein n=1 Tax=Streptomyces sp. CoH27 TaxID=2875763 RepID=UPI001CD25DFF|nr:DUF6083 domain-containing protein [Streptomyces sp. CoH27]
MGGADETSTSALPDPDDAMQRVIPLPSPDEQWQPPPGTPQPWMNVDRAQAAMDGADAPEPPSPPLCPHCGLVGERHPTYYGAYVLFQPGLTAPAHMVPAWHRWYVDPNGTAWNSGHEEPAPGAECRVPHRLACPGLTLEEIGLWRWLDAVRQENARCAQRQADEQHVPGSLPDVG